MGGMAVASFNHNDMKRRRMSRVLATALVTLWVAVMIASVFVLPSIANSPWNTSWAESWVRGVVPADCDAFGRRLIVDAEAGKTDAILSYVEPQFRNASAVRGLNKGAALAKPVSGGTVELIRFGSSAEQCGLLYLVQRADQRVVVDEAFARSGGNFKLESFYFTQITPKMLAQNALTLAGRNVGHWTFAILTIADLLFVAGVLYLCALARYVRFRWLWLLAILVGIIRFTMNWTTGEASVQPISFNFPPAGASEPIILGPWFVYLDVPVGAILFLVFRKKLTQEREERKEWTQTSSSSEPVQPA